MGKLKVVNGHVLQESTQERDARMFRQLSPEQRGWVLELGASAQAEAVVTAGNLACTYAFFFGQAQGFFEDMPLGSRIVRLS